MIRDAGFVLESPDGEPIEGDPLEGVPENFPGEALPVLTGV